MHKEASLFKVLSDVTRLRLASLLLANGETCVCMLAQALNEQDFKISRHLGVMRHAGLIKARREGTWMHYKLVEPCSDFEQSFHEFLRNGLADHPTLKKDLDRLSQATCSKGEEKKGNVPPPSNCAKRQGQRS